MIFKLILLSLKKQSHPDGPWQVTSTGPSPRPADHVAPEPRASGERDAAASRLQDYLPKPCFSSQSLPQQQSIHSLYLSDVTVTAQ